MMFRSPESLVASAPQKDPHDCSRRRPGRASSFYVVLLAAAVSVSPALLWIPYYLTHRSAYPASGDHALIELQVRTIGHHPVLVGPYSREGWFHPGPALYYILLGPYWLLGRSSVTLPVMALVINALCVAAATWIAYRRLGAAGSLVLLAVLAVYLRFAEPGFWRDAWNPTVPVLPFAVVVLLCWSLLDGDLPWAAPVVVAIGSFCVQCHLGFLLPVAGVLAATGVAVTARSCRRHGLWAALGRGRTTIATGFLVLALLWTLPIAQQLTGREGNLAAIWHYLRIQRPDATWTLGLRQVSTQLGSVPAYLAGRAPTIQTGVPPPLFPLWTGILGLFCFIVSVVFAVRLRVRTLLHLALLATIVGVSGVVAVSRIDGPVFPYLVQWTAIAGVLCWMTVGGTIVVGVHRLAAGSRGRDGHRSRGLVRRSIPAVAVLVIVAILTGFTIRTTARTVPGATAEGPPLATAVLRWLGPDSRGLAVHVDPAPGPFVGGWPTDLTVGITPGVVLVLLKHGVKVRVSTFFKRAYPPWTQDDPGGDRYRVLVAPLAHPPRNGGRLLGSVSGYGVYGTRSSPVRGAARPRSGS